MRTISTSYLFKIPQIVNYDDLAYQLKISHHLLYKFSHVSEKFYRQVHIPKKNGSLRTLYCPSKKIKAIQLWILRNILEKIEPTIYAKAFRKYTSVLDNVTPHKTNDFFLCLDIEDFYGSITHNMVFNIFVSLGYNSSIANILTKICTFNDSIPQGAVTSPALSNICCIWSDIRLSRLSGLNNITYTRYADDMTFSSTTPSNLLKCKSIIFEIIKDEGFIINQNKTRMLGSRSKREITGLLVSNNRKNPNKEHSIGIGNKQKRIIRAAINNLIMDKVPEPEITKVTNWIQGWISYLKSVDPKAAEQLQSYYSKREIRLSQVEAAVDTDDFDLPF